MALVSLVIIDKNYEPIYMKDFVETPTNPSILDADGPFEFEQGPMFQMDASNKSSSGSFSCSLRHQFVLHGAMDRFEALAGPQPTNKFSWRAPGTMGPEAMWVGLICPVEDMRVYGYVTTTKLRFMAIVEDAFLPDQINQQEARETELKNLMYNIHSLYVEYTLNPFSKIEGPIESQRFDTSVDSFVSAFNGVGTAVI